MPSFAKISLQVIMGTALVLYPLFVYFMLDKISPTLILGTLLILLIARLVLFSKNNQKKKHWLLLGAGSVCFLFGALLDGELGLRAYPVLVNAVMFFIFALSLIKPPSMIERFASLSKQTFNQNALNYMHNVTIVWCIFFIINGSIAAFTACCTSMEIWTLYNGLISYILMGTLMGVELIVRYFKKKHDA